MNKKMKYEVSESEKKLLKKLNSDKTTFRSKMLENFCNSNTPYNPNLTDYLDFLALQPTRFNADDLETIACQAERNKEEISDICELHTYDVWENELNQTFISDDIGSTAKVKPYFLNVVAEQNRLYYYSPSHFALTDNFSADLFFSNGSIINYEKKKPSKKLSANVCGYVFLEYLKKNQYTYEVQVVQDTEMMTYLNPDTSVIVYYSQYQIDSDSKNRTLEFLLPSLLCSYAERTLKKELILQKKQKVFDEKSRKSILFADKYQNNDIDENEYKYLASVIAYMTMTKLGINNLSAELHACFTGEPSSPEDNINRHIKGEKLLEFWKQIYNFNLNKDVARLLRMQYEENPNDDCIFLQRLDLCRDKSEEFARLIKKNLNIEGKLSLG